MPRESNETEPTALMDRRQATRHAVERPCHLKLNADPSEQLSGLTTNMSRSGILVRFPEAPADGVLPSVGEQASLEVDLPPSDKYAPRSLECVGRVVRIESEGEKTSSLALEVERMHIRDRPPRKARQASMTLQ